MSADLILAAFPWPETPDGRPIPPSPKLAQAVRDRVLGLEGQERQWALEDIEEKLADETDLPMDASDEEIEVAVAEQLPARLSDILDPWFAENGKHIDVLLDAEHDDVVANSDRDTVTFRLRGHWYVFSGGMSWGDDPTDSFDTINFIAGLYDLLVEPFDTQVAD